MSSDVKSGRQGMSSGLKTALILVLLGGVVFGVTVIGSYSGGFKQVAEPDGPDGTIAESPAGEPLKFPYTTIAYDPLTPDEEGGRTNWGNLKRAYPGFTEVSEGLSYQSFWFEQPHKKEVRVAVKGRSCSACTSARIGTLPADPLADYVKQVRDGKAPLPLGPAEALTASLFAAGVSVNKQIVWHELDFDQPSRTVTIPAAGPAGPQVGVFQMIYKTLVIGEKALDAYVAANVEGGAPAQYTLKTVYLGVPAFRMVPIDGKMQLGDIPEGAPPRTVDVLCWSATRRREGTGLTLPPPAVAVIPKDPFVEAGTPVAVPDADLGRVAAQLMIEGRMPPVLAAYQVPVTIHRTRPANATPGTPPEPDLGTFERELALTVPGETKAQSITLVGNFTGLVTLTDVKVLDLESFPSRTGKPEKGFTLVSDRPGLKLSVAADECKPRFVAARLSEAEDVGGRRRWRLALSVPPNVALGEFPADSVVVLLADTGDGTPRRVKLTLKGRAHTGR